jgi:phospholipase/lecithinase/hemolysin
MTLTHSILRSGAVLLAIVLLAAPVSSAAATPQFDSFYVFGDSLADNGNIFLTTKALQISPAVPPSETPHQTYFNGRFSNGYVGFEHLWQQLSGHAPGSAGALKPFFASFSGPPPAAINFAFGGTGTPFADLTPGGLLAPGLKGQVELFRLALRGKKPSKQALFAIVTGANDYRVDPYNVPMDPHDVVKNIVDAVERLYALGARHAMVLDLPDLGLIPANSGNPGPPSQISALHNLLLDNALADLQTRFPKLHLISVKLAPLFLELLSTLESHVPALELFSAPGMSACLFVNPTLCQNVSPALFNNLTLGFLFWDVVHPTAEAHHKLAQYLYAQLVASYSTAISGATLDHVN